MSVHTGLAREWPWQEAMPFAAGLLGVAITVGVQDVYLRMYSGAPKLIVIALIAALGIPLLMVIQRLGRWGTSVVRFVAAATTVYAICEIAGTSAISAGGLTLLMLIAGCTALWVRDTWWPRTRRVLVAVPLLFAVTPILIGPAMAPATEWPGRPVSSDRDQQSLPVVFLLLDELGASAVQPLVDALVAQGWPVASKAIEPVGDMTLKVIPQMFTGRPFPNARPCAPTTVCDHFHALNFSTVTASRTDIDIVGFYHPYCAIQGLRWCLRVAPEPALLSWDRWRCGVVKYLDPGSQHSECRQIPLQRWGRFVDSVLAGVDQAPFWHQGGMLYIHVPLPHPPGSSSSGSLGEHYADNIARATGFVAHLSILLRKRFGTNARLVIFSDHGLRYQYACSTPLYSSMACEVQDTYKGHEVPLIVAGPAATSMSRVSTNADIFSLVY